MVFQRCIILILFFFFSSRRRHTRCGRDWSSDVCSSDLVLQNLLLGPNVQLRYTPYDLAKAAERIRDTKYPQAQDFAARNVLQSPSEGEIGRASCRERV